MRFQATAAASSRASNPFDGRRPPRHRHPAVGAAATAFLLPFLAGCQTSSETFPGRPADQVWTAMVKAAEQPAYRDWHVVENDVWADETSGRIEIYRLLRRYKDPPGQWARLEDQTWKFSIQFEPTEPASASFAIRSWAVPSHSWGEGDRYFDQVWTLLGGRPMPGAVVPPATMDGEAPASTAPAATTESDAAGNEPPVDLPE